MFSPLNDPQVEDWFQRLNAAWKRMPADEQVRQREEVQQHLESLIADREKQGEAPDTAWRVALDQFGDPESFGRRIAEEWRQSKRGFRADLTAIGFGLGLNILFWLFAGPLCGLWFQSLRDAHGIGVFTFVGALRLVIGYSGLILVNSAIGLRYPLQALKGAFYSHILWETWTAGTTFMLLIALTAHSQNGLAFTRTAFQVEASVARVQAQEEQKRLLAVGTPRAPDLMGAAEGVAKGGTVLGGILVLHEAAFRGITDGQTGFKSVQIHSPFAGKNARKCAPSPTRPTSAMLPRCASRIPLTMLRPSPSPRAREVKKGVKMRGLTSAGMPGPESKNSIWR